MRGQREIQLRIAQLSHDLQTIENAESEAASFLIGQLSALSWVLGEYEWDLSLLAAYSILQNKDQGRKQ